jgi:hypothetical protein
MNWDDAQTLAECAGYELVLGPYRVYGVGTSSRNGPYRNNGNTGNGPFDVRYSVTLIADGRKMSVSDLRDRAHAARAAVTLIEEANIAKNGTLAFKAKGRYNT